MYIKTNRTIRNMMKKYGKTRESARLCRGHIFFNDRMTVETSARNEYDIPTTPSDHNEYTANTPVVR
jgi:hypothetical protein